MSTAMNKSRQNVGSHLIWYKRLRCILFGCYYGQWQRPNRRYFSRQCLVCGSYQHQRREEDSLVR